LFNKIAQLRELLGLGVPHWNTTLNTLAQTYGETGAFPKIEENVNYMIISKLYFRDEFRKETSDQLVETWLSDASKRQVLLAPGNYSSVVVIPPDEGPSTPSVVVVVMAFIFR
jgi:hypothetical protein